MIPDIFGVLIFEIVLFYRRGREVVQVESIGVVMPD